MIRDANLAVQVVFGFFFLIACVAFVVECDSCVDRNCPPGYHARMLRGPGKSYECACIVRPR